MLPNAGCVLVTDSTVLLYIKIVEGAPRENSYQEPLRPGYAITRDGEGAQFRACPRVARGRQQRTASYWLLYLCAGTTARRRAVDTEVAYSNQYQVPRRIPSTMEQVVRAGGHENVTAEHGSTFEVTSDDWLTPAGDCILAVEADAVPAEFDGAFVAACRSPEATITATLRAGGHEQVIEGRGHPGLTFDGDRSMVVRTSEYVDDRTVMVGADAAAADLDRGLVAALADGADLECVLRVE